MRLVWILVLFIQMTIPSHAQRVVEGDVTPGLATARNYIKNPSAHKNASFGTSTSSATLTRDTDTADKLDGIASFICDASAQNGYCQWDTNTIQEGDKTGNCAAQATYKGDASLYKLQVYDGSNVVNSSSVLSNASDWTTVTVNYLCGSTRSVRLTQTESGTGAAVNIGRVTWSSALNVVSINQISDWTSYTPATTGLGTVTGVNFKWRRVGSDMEISGYLTTGTVTASTAEIALPTGHTISLNTSTTAVGYWYGDITTNPANKSGSVVGTNGLAVLRFSQYRVDSAISPLSEGTGSNIFLNSTRYSVYAKVPITGWAIGQAYKPDQSGWYIDANLAGGNASMGTANVASYTEITGASLVLTQNSGSAAVQIPCATTNAPTGTTCSASSESVGVAFYPPYAGTFEACVEYSHQITLTAGGSNYLQTTFQIVETPTNAQTISQEGKERTTSGFGVNAATLNPFVVNARKTCGIFTFTSTSQKVLRLMFEQDGSGVNTSQLQADTSSALGQRDIHWSVRPISQSIPAPLLVNSVVNSSSAVTRTEAAIVTPTGAACTITRQHGSWIGSATGAANGRCALVFSPAWSVAPICTCTPGNSSGSECIIFTAATTTGVELYVGNSSGTAVNQAINVTCTGAR